MAALYRGRHLSLLEREQGCVELCFNAAQATVNIFNRQTSQELSEALDCLEARQDLAGLLISSAKSGFIAGADITEFKPIFTQGAPKVAELLAFSNRNFNRIEDLSVPTVAAINGFALGGGCEFCLACDYRIGDASTRIGLPETRLGIIPGWGGTVRLPRIAGIETAIEWIASGKHYAASEALKAGVLDGVIAPGELLEGAFNTLLNCVAGQLDYRQRRDQKQQPLKHNAVELTMALTSSAAFVATAAGKHYPAPRAVVEVIKQAASCGREQALAVETQAFIAMTQTPQAIALSGIFLNDQLIAKKAKSAAKLADKPIARAAVLGAGIMGGGICYQSAVKGIPVKMKDIAQASLDLGLAEANKLLVKRVERGRLTPAEAGAVLNTIEPTLSYDGFESVDMVVEAVVENPQIKASVLAEVEAQVDKATIIATNTSTISVDQLAQSLRRPENFCGMHFFNPVHAMPLVEVIRGSQSSDRAIAHTVAYAAAMGKKAIVVKDCPGFLVNRVLFPYLAGFLMLLRDGADYQHIDQVMEAWGWPMGPAYLVDVVGIDTCIHAEQVMAEGFPARMRRDYPAATERLYQAGHYGQKTGQGFYQYSVDKKGKPLKRVAEEVEYLLSAESLPAGKSAATSFTEEEIIARMLVPMATELALCLEEGVVDTAAEADMAMVYGLGFPPFRGGILRWLDTLGMETFQAMASKYQHLGPLYQLTPGMERKRVAGESYYV